MDRQESKKKPKWHEVIAVVAMTAVMLGIYGLLRSDLVQDLWRGFWYKEPAAVQDLRMELELTGNGERIFLATQPLIEEAESFNKHCGEHHDEVSLLGCYNGGKIYVYDVQLESLEDSNKVTAAHELLHAIWVRLSRQERQEVVASLENIRREKAEWVRQETSLYRESEQMEELYARVGTKLAEIPQELEKHYGKYFENRAKIVEFYESYQAPFRELKEKNEKLRVRVEEIGKEIETERLVYESRLQNLNDRIDEFNLCAGTAGCFATDAIFERERASLEQERKDVNELREKLNEKIDENNRLVLEYEENRRSLGELNDALNSNVKDKLS